MLIDSYKGPFVVFVAGRVLATFIEVPVASLEGEDETGFISGTEFRREGSVSIMVGRA